MRRVFTSSGLGTARVKYLVRMEYKSFEPGIEVSGASVGVLQASFRLFPKIATGLLERHGILKTSTESASPNLVGTWHPLEAWLAALKEVETSVGPKKMFEIGCAAPQHATLPPTIFDIHSALSAMDFAYHMNHRRQGGVMFDPNTGVMLEGIGHYGYQCVAGERRIVSVCETPYGCAADRGIVFGFARRFERTVQIEHPTGDGCRALGGKRCTYVLTW